MTVDSDDVRSALRVDLLIAMKTREPDTVAALRTAIAAIDNAEAVEASHAAVPTAGEHFAGTHVGVGSTETARRNLTTDDVRAILREQVTERSIEADRYEQLGQREAAARLRREADALAEYLSA